MRDRWWRFRKRLGQRLQPLTDPIRYWITGLYEPVMALLALLAGVLLFYGWLHWQHNPQWSQTAQIYYLKTPLPDYISRLQALAALTTRNAEYAVLRDNMERLRLMVELYPVEGGHYPRNIQALYSHAAERDFWILSRNPLTQVFNVHEQIVADYSDWKLSTERERFKGMVLYEPISTYGYRIYACNAQGELVQDNQGVFSLSNLEY